MDTADPPHDENAQHNTEGEAQIKSNDSAAELPPILAKSEPQPPEARYAITRKPEKDWWDKAKPFAEILGILILLVYTIYTIRMYYANKEAADAARSASETAIRTLSSSDDSFKKTLSQMEAQTTAQKKSANASMEQAEASKRVVETARQSLQATIDNFHLDQRPWIIPFQFRLDGEPENLRDIKVTVWAENTGKTPALEIIPATKTELLTLEPDPPDFSNVAPVVSRGILAPSVRNFNFDTVANHFKPKLTDVAAYQDSRKRIYVSGIVYYRDPSTIRHWTRFCVWHKFGMPPDDFSFCEHGNEVDRQEANKQ
jgi:Ca2+/Na+ antiporter